ncbi:MAG: hypothetical protein ABIO44_03680, partial [Saprospiraceae bacterium]
YILKNIKKSSGFIFGLIIILSSMLVFIRSVESYFEGYKLYFKQFEFNSSAFIILSKILVFFGLPQFWSYRGLFLFMLFAVVAIIFLFKFYRSQRNIHDFLKYAFMTYSIFILVHSTIHPWYVIPLFCLGLFSFPLTSLFISFIVVFSYSFYDSYYSYYYEIIRIIEYLSCIGLYLYEKRTPIFANRGS